MLTEKQSKFIKHLLAKKGYRSDDYGWLILYSIKQASKLIDNLLNQTGGWATEFIAGLPAPVIKVRQASLPLPSPSPEPLPPDDPSIPPELTEFKRWAREVFQHGELTMKQLCELQDAKFGNPFAT